MVEHDPLAHAGVARRRDERAVDLKGHRATGAGTVEGCAAEQQLPVGHARIRTCRRAQETISTEGKKKTCHNKHTRQTSGEGDEVIKLNNPVEQS